MPNAKCDKCHKYLENICINNKQKLLLIKLIKERSKKSFGIVYNINPGITHDEINQENIDLNGIKCNGILWYNHLAKNPKGFEDIDFSKILFDSINIEEIEKKILKNQEKDENYCQIKDENNCQIIKEKKNEENKNYQVIKEIEYEKNKNCQVIKQIKYKKNENSFPLLKDKNQNNIIYIMVLCFISISYLIFIYYYFFTLHKCFI